MRLVGLYPVFPKMIIIPSPSELHEKPPEELSFTMICHRLGLKVCERIFTLTLQRLQENRLLRGKNPGIEASVIEADASLRELINRNTEERYWH